MNIKRFGFVPILFTLLLTGCITVIRTNNQDNEQPTTDKGKFVIRVDNDDNSLKMDVHSSFDSLTDFIEDTDLPGLSSPYSYKWFNQSTNNKFSDIHNEYTESLMGKDGDGLKFYKFTFFLKNVGETDSSYYMDIKLTGLDKNHVDEYIRVLAFEGLNKQTVYAKPSTTSSANDGKEYIDSADQELGVAEKLNDNDISIGPNTLSADQNIKFTFLFWLEGGDPECQNVPDNVPLNVEVNIKGYK